MSLAIVRQCSLLLLFCERKLTTFSKDNHMTFKQHVAVSMFCNLLLIILFFHKKKKLASHTVVLHTINKKNQWQVCQIKKHLVQNTKIGILNN